MAAMTMPIKYPSISICLVDKYSSFILLDELKKHCLSPKDVQPTFWYSRRGLNFSVCWSTGKPNFIHTFLALKRNSLQYRNKL